MRQEDIAKLIELAECNLKIAKQIPAVPHRPELDAKRLKQIAKCESQLQQWQAMRDKNFKRKRNELARN